MYFNCIFFRDADTRGRTLGSQLDLSPAAPKDLTAQGALAATYYRHLPRPDILGYKPNYFEHRQEALFAALVWGVYENYCN